MNTARKQKDRTRQGGFAGSSRQGTQSEAGPRLLCLAGETWNLSFGYPRGGAEEVGPQLLPGDASASLDADHPIQRDFVPL
jgi:hypothetical protein